MKKIIIMKMGYIGANRWLGDVYCLWYNGIPAKTIIVGYAGITALAEHLKNTDDVEVEELYNPLAFKTLLPSKTVKQIAITLNNNTDTKLKEITETILNP